MRDPQYFTPRRGIDAVGILPVDPPFGDHVVMGYAGAGIGRGEVGSA